MNGGINLDAGTSARALARGRWLESCEPDRPIAMNGNEHDGAEYDGRGNGPDRGPRRPRYGTYDYLRQHQHAPANAPPNSEMIRDFEQPGRNFDLRQDVRDELRRQDRAQDRARSEARGAGPEPGARQRRGPKGYVRPDRRILEEVCERLTEDEALDPSGFSVTVESGVVTLLGTVDSEWARRYAEELVSAVGGVESCRNRLRVSSRD